MYKHKFSKRVFPSERYVIQGILRPECTPKENRQKLKRCRTQTLQKTQIKLCSACDFQDKHSGYCLIKRLHCSCPYTNGSTGYV
ncbi:MAG: hypothetical protein WDA42_09455, partial [Candidatus Bathyarchaeia archaeon]